jgi:glycosyltransferase involved in cell wall biosynthesis
VLISNKVNIWREIEADGAGLVHSDDLDGTVRALRQFLGSDANDRAAMSTRALGCFERRFRIQKAASRLVEIIEENRGDHRGQ